MSRADQRSAAELGSGSSSAGNSPALPPRRRVRKRRYHISRQALGLDFYRWHTMGVAEPASTDLPPVPVPPVAPAAVATAVTPTTPATELLPPATPDAAALAQAEFQLEAERHLELCRKALGTCTVIFFLVLFHRWIIIFLIEAPFAWPGLHGGF